MGVKQLLGTLAQRLAEERFIELDNIRILVAQADGLAFILAVDGSRTGLQDLDIAVMIRLARAADAAARAGHHFHDMVVEFPFAQLVHQDTGIAERVGHTDLEREAGQVDSRFLDALETADFGEFQFLEHLARIDFIDRTESRFHHAARRAKDGAGTGGLAQRRVEITVRELGKADVGPLDETCQFAGGDGIVHIGIVAVHGELFALAFVFLGQARHDRDDHHLLGIDAPLFTPPGLGNGAEHLGRRLGRRRIVEQVGIVVLEEIDPGRAARRHDRKLDALVAGQMSLQAFEDLGACFHDGKGGGEVRVEHLGKAQVTEGGYHLAGHDGAGLHAELLAEGHADSGSRLGDDDLVGVHQVVHQAVGVVTLGQGARRADGDALAAISAIRVLKHAVEGRSDGGVETAADSAEDTHGLDIVAHSLATAAEDALVHVARDGGGNLFLAGGLLATGERHLADIETHHQALQFAVTALGTSEAVVRVVGEHQFRNGLAGLDDARGVGLHDHAFGADRGAGRSQVAAAFHFHDADTAGSRIVLHAGAFEVDVAERGDGDADGSRGIEDGRARCNGDRAVVYGKIDFFVHRGTRLRRWHRSGSATSTCRSGYRRTD